MKAETLPEVGEPDWVGSEECFVEVKGRGEQEIGSSIMKCAASNSKAFNASRTSVSKSSKTSNSKQFIDAACIEDKMLVFIKRNLLKKNILS